MLSDHSSYVASEPHSLRVTFDVYVVVEMHVSTMIVSVVDWDLGSAELEEVWTNVQEEM